MRSIRSRLAAVAILCVLPFSVAFMTETDTGFAIAPGDYAPAPLPHPHFPKTLNCKLPKGLEITVSHLTVTFNKEGAKKMPVGGAWHLAGATFESTGDLVIGGEQVKAGKYALSARKAKEGWELTLHEGKGFSRPSKKVTVIALKTEFTADTLLFEHLNCDIQPGGDKDNTKLFLDVRFDTMLARVLIEIPKK
tara:strand:+ start:37691 stop:38269 length:579 start_codon:yes stop_codon:yes gene_type:complete